MYRARRIVALMLMTAILSLGLTTQAQQRRAPSMKTRSAPVERSYLTGVYRLDAASSDDPRAVAERAAGNLTRDEQQRVVDELTTRLTAPDLLAIERRGRTIDIASSRAPRISFEADGRERIEQAADGHQVRTRAVLYGDELMVSSSGNPENDFSVTFDPMDDGRRLRVTRRINSAQLNQSLVIQSIYNKSSDVARWGIFRDQQNAETTTPTVAANTEQPPPVDNGNSWPQPQFPSLTGDDPSQPPPTTETERSEPLIIPNGTQLVAVLNNDLSTAQSREGDRFQLTVRAPGPYDGAIIDGYISNVRRAGRISGRSEMRLNFERISLRDGRTSNFAGYIEGVRTVSGEDVRVETEGGVQDRDDQAKRTAQRAAIGAAVGAIIGALAGGGKGAAIGAAIGAGAGAGSVYAQGRNDLQLRNGTEITLRSTATR